MDPGSILRILLLGPPAVYLNDVPVIIPRLRTRALLFYLACQPGPVERTHLADIFWQDKEEVTCRCYLRETLNKLRSALPNQSLILTPHDQIGLDFSRIYVDVREFRLLATTMGINPRAIGDPLLPPMIFQQYQKAANLWRLPQFMAGANLPSTEALDEWLTLTTVELDAARRNILLRLADHQAEMGDLEDAISWVRKGLSADPLNIGLHRRLLQWMVRLGRYGEVQAHCDLIINQYPEDQALGSVMNDYRQKAIELTTFIQPEDHRPWESQVGYSIRFVGRLTELDTLKKLYTRGGAALIYGEAGYGKTRLLYELTRRVEPPPYLLMTSCQQGDAEIAMQAWIEILRNHISPEEWQQLKPIWSTIIGRILPELFSLQPNLPVPDAAWATDARPLLFEAIHQLLQLVSKNRQLLLVIDNAHHCDKESLSTLEYLIQRHFFQSRGLLALAARVEEDSPALSKFLERVRPGRQIQIIHLEPLNIQEITELSSFMLREVPSPDVVQNIHDATLGNPLFLIETLVAHPPRREACASEEEKIPLSVSLQSIIQERFEQLNPASALVVSVAAVIGSRFPLWLLYSVISLPPEDLLGILDDLLKRRLIQVDEEEQAGGGYRFVHDRFAEIIYQQISQPRRQMLHLQIANALASSSTADSNLSGVIAYHFEAGGDMRSAFTYLLDSGDHARQIYSYETAFQAFKRAEELMAQLGDQVTDDEIYRLYINWERVGYASLNYETANHTGHCLIKAGEERRNPLLMGSGLRHLGYYHINTKDPARALIYFERAYPYLVQTGNVLELTGIGTGVGNGYFLLHQYSESMEMYERTQQLVIQDDNPSLLIGRVTIGYTLARLYGFCGFPLKALENARRALDNSHRLMYPSGVILSKTMLGLAQMEMGQMEDAFLVLSAALEEALETGNIHSTLHVKLMLAHIHLDQGHLDLAWNLASGVEEQANQLQDLEMVDLCHAIRGMIFLQLGDYPKAVNAFQNGWLREEKSYAGLYNLAFLGTALCFDGKENSGSAFLTQASTLGRKAGLGYVYLQADMALGYFLANVGLLDQAQLYVDQVNAEYQTRKIENIFIHPEWVYARIALARGQSEEAFRLGKLLLDKAKKQGNLWIEIRSTLLIIECLQMEGYQGDLSQRIIMAVDELVRNTTIPELQDSLQNFQKNLTACYK